MYPIGSIYISFNPTLPSIFNSADWTEITDAVITARKSGETVSGSTTGSDSKSVPVTQHYHYYTPSGSVSVSGSTVSDGSHTHPVIVSDGHKSREIVAYEGHVGDGDDLYPTNGWVTDAHNPGNSAVATAAGYHNHTINFTSSLSGTRTTTENQGTANASMNVVPKHINVYMWKRTKIS